MARENDGCRFFNALYDRIIHVLLALIIFLINEKFIEFISSGYTLGSQEKRLLKKYELTLSSLDKWINQSENTGSFKEKDNLSLEGKELIKLRKENKQLLMENDILKQTKCMIYNLFLTSSFLIL